MRRRWKWISVLLLIAALVGVAWWLRQQPIAAMRRPLAATQSPPAAHWPASIPIPSLKTPTPGGQIHEIEICGVGKVKLDPNDITAAGKYLEALTRNTRLRWLATLRNSDDYRARASGLYLEGILDRDSPQNDPETARDELVQLAVGTKDPAAFSLAYSKCIKGVEDSASQGACPQLILADWTHADPDNAVPWLQVAAKARRENDAAAEAAAFAQASQAHRYETYIWSLFSYAQATIPNDATATDRWILTTQIIGVEAAMGMPYLPLFQYCSREALSDATVHQQCNALTELLVGKATTLIDLSAGRALGGRVGWPTERLDALTQELKASMQAVNQENSSDPKQQWNCDSVARGNAFMSQWDDLGERGLAKQAIQRSGESVAELAHKFDEHMAAAAREAAAAQR